MIHKDAFLYIYIYTLYIGIVERLVVCGETERYLSLFVLSLHLEATLLFNSSPLLLLYRFCSVSSPLTTDLFSCVLTLREQSRSMLMHDVILGDALNRLLCTPFRRVMFFQAAKFDLIDEKMIKEDDKDETSHAWSLRAWGRRLVRSVRALYEAGGVQIFFRGALLDAAAVIFKFWVQVYVVIPCLRLMPPLPMTSFFLLSTFWHTAVNFIPLVPLQASVMVVNVNATTDFLREEAEADSMKDSFSLPSVTQLGSSAPTSAIPETLQSDPASPPPNITSRFSSYRELLGTLAERLPFWKLTKKLLVIEFTSRYFTSVVYNYVLSLYYNRRMSPLYRNRWYHTGVVGILVGRGFPLCLSLAVSLVTYPLINFSFVHFFRVKHYERLRQQAIFSKVQEQRRGYLSCDTSRRNSLQSSDLENERPRRERHLKSSVALGSWWIESMFMNMCHVDVQEFLSSTIEKRGVFAIYSGFGAYALHLFASSIVGIVVHNAVGRLHKGQDGF